jgi:hypothetical protein
MQQNQNIMALMNIFAHITNISYIFFEAGIGGIHSYALEQKPGISVENEH